MTTLQNPYSVEISVKLTFTQCKQIIENHSREDLEQFIENFNDQPDFLLSMGGVTEISEMQAILQGGCASGAFMPAVTYGTAMQVMCEHSDSVESNITCVEELTFKPSEDSFSHFCTELVSTAVEDWCQHFSDILDGVNWD